MMLGQPTRESANCEDFRDGLSCARRCARPGSHGTQDHPTPTKSVRSPAQENRRKILRAQKARVGSIPTPGTFLMFELRTLDLHTEDTARHPAP